jgi:2-polyprenyl-3-methyl-5-hydroxy-6-metoxy-1,4-benzoquinol methylase
MPTILNEFIIDKEKNKNFLDILTKKLFYFYNETNNYEPFKKINNSRYWDLIFEDIRVSVGSEKIRLLEVGSGRSGFASKLIEHNLRGNVHYTAQDITYKNYDFLIENADEVFIGDVSKLGKKYDIIFSTFVLEHIVDPDRFLDILFNLLFENGREYIICPRYDFPFYLSPSIKHRST